MPESKTAWVEREVRYFCDREDGGEMLYDTTVFDQQGVPAYDHHCTNPDDHEVYRFTIQYPHIELVNISQIIP